MNGCKIAVGFSLLCALSLCAFAAPSAMAANGATVFTCVEGGGSKEFADPDCAEQVEGKGKYGHVEIKAGAKTTAEITDDKSGASKFEGTIAGVKAEILCLGPVKGAEQIENVAAMPMNVSGIEVQINFTECTPVGVLATDGCQVINGEVIIEKTTNISLENTMEVEFKPTGANLALIRLQNCETKGFNGAFPLRGTMKAITEGARLTFTEGSTKGLKLAGSQGSLTAKLTLKMSGGGNAISYTTTN